MGSTFSCPGADSIFDNTIDAALTRTISFQRDDKETLLSPFSASFNGRNPESPILQALGSGKMIIEGSLSFKARNSGSFKLETKLSFRAAEESEPVRNDPEPIKHEAAVKLQKVYKSFRTRRKLADCAVLAEQRWWSLLDTAMLKRSSVSFFDVEQPESVASRWYRARRRAAKVGKGLSKDKKARKLALQHWLEAIDHRHRYGHNLQFYYVRWLNCESREPFFYWLDVGEGRDVNLEQCPRWKLQQQCIKYLGEKERETYEVMVEGGKLIYKQSLQPVDTSGDGPDTKWIFVLSTSKTLYVGQKKKGIFQHSSFLAGGATSCAGRLVAEKGTLKAIWPHSGHYRPTEENFQEFVYFLTDKNVDLANVKKYSTEDEEESVKGGVHTISSDAIICRDNFSQELDDSPSEIFETPTCSSNEESEGEEDEEKKNTEKESSIYQKKNLFSGEEGGREGKNSPPFLKEKILRRINSKKETGSYQLGRQISFKWTTGVGPRIGCVRDYPPELQLHALEQVCLSPVGNKKTSVRLGQP